MGGSISGLSSGLDTANIIDAIMAVKRQRVDKLEIQKEEAQSEINAWGQVTTKLAGLKLSAYSLSKTSSWDVKQASSNIDGISRIYCGIWKL
jgi:flagellar hook-associated protein 2